MTIDQELALARGCGAFITHSTWVPGSGLGTTIEFNNEGLNKYTNAVMDIVASQQDAVVRVYQEQVLEKLAAKEEELIQLRKQFGDCVGNLLSDTEHVTFLPGAKP